ncbi:MAG: hypothetical protein H6658_02010 [Ardenticatenaceae bacterium]|nr:hypothetical protein [Ardenticatenaceae bacterium]
MAERVQLPTWTEGSTYKGLLLTWTDEAGNPEDLTGATITGRIKNKQAKASRDVAGSIVPTANAAEGEAQWTFHVDDVVAGQYEVQLKAVRAGKPWLSFVADWEVEEVI